MKDNYRDLLQAAMKVGASLDDAHDAVQTAVLDMLKKGTWSRLTRNPEAWMRQAVQHAYYDRQRKRRRDREIESLSPPTGCGLDSGLNVWENRQWAAQLLNTLPPAQREVFELILAGLNTREIADLLGKTPATIRQNLAHARRRLRADLGPDYPINPNRNRRKKDTP